MRKQALASLRLRFLVLLLSVLVLASVLRFSKLILRLRVGLLPPGVGVGRGGEGWDCPLGVSGAVQHADSAFGVHIAASGTPGGEVGCRAKFRR